LWSAFVTVDAAILGVEAGRVAKSPHNLILDAWLSAGIVGAAATVLFLSAYLRIWLREVRRYLTGAPGWVLSLRHFWVIAVGVIPLVRAFTGGNNLHLNGWVCVGMVFGLVEANRRAAAARSPAV
jgi:O-antigen ligase